MMFKHCMILEHNRMSGLLFYIKVNPENYHKSSIKII